MLRAFDFAIALAVKLIREDSLGCGFNLLLGYAWQDGLIYLQGFYLVLNVATVKTLTAETLILTMVCHLQWVQIP